MRKSVPARGDVPVCARAAPVVPHGFNGNGDRFTFGLRCRMPSPSLPRAAPAAPSPADLAAWIGRTETATDTVTATPAQALAATLDRADPAPRTGDPLPACWHWLFFLPLHRASDLGPDGHAKRGGFLPPVTLPRRMWAGSRVTFVAPLRIGDAATRTSRIADVVAKAGRSGPLVFVKVHHEIAVGGTPVIVEEQDLVYREPPDRDEPAPPPRRAPETAQWDREVIPDDVLLFRYSALTFNGHRIHYDRRYCTTVEGYPGLVVHGPLIATLLLDLVRRERPDAVVRRFSFRAVHPTFDLAPFHVCGSETSPGRVSLWARHGDGTLAVEADAELD